MGRQTLCQCWGHCPSCWHSPHSAAGLQNSHRMLKMQILQKAVKNKTKIIRMMLIQWEISAGASWWIERGYGSANVWFRLEDEGRVMVENREVAPAETAWQARATSPGDKLNTRPNTCVWVCKGCQASEGGDVISHQRVWKVFCTMGLMMDASRWEEFEVSLTFFFLFICIFLQ